MLGAGAEGIIAAQRSKMSIEKNDLHNLVRRAGEMCHDFNQPLTVILARGELVLMRLSPEDPNYQAVEQINQQAQKLAHLVENLRRLLKGYTGG